MKTNVGIELNDEQRALLHLRLYGKSGMLTRKQINELCVGMFNGSLDAAQHDEPERVTEAVPVTLPEPYATRYADQTDSWKAGWLRGWNLVGSR